MIELSRENIPQHIAIIMDGNGRWAKKRLMNRINGHRKGMDAVKDVVIAASEFGVPYLTLFAFSSENWKRPPEEVKALMSLLGKYLKSELQLMMDKGIRLRAVGNIDKIPPKERAVLQDTIDKTSKNEKMVLSLALSYGGRGEIVSAARSIALKVSSGLLRAEDINEENFASNLLTSDVPDPDLLIRTSGEMRISNFLLWQLAYTELYFTDTLWPDFGRDDLVAAISDFQSRERRFGRTGEQLLKKRAKVC